MALKNEKEEKRLRKVIYKHSYVNNRLPTTTAAHFSWAIEVIFPSIDPLTEHIKVFPLIVNVNNVNPVKYKGKPN